MARSMRRHPLVIFFLLVFVVGWVVWVPRASGAQLGVVGQAWTWSPAVAALLAAALTGGRAAVAELGARLVRWRVGWQWYLVVVLGPAAFSLAVAGIYALLGGSWSAAAPPALLEGPLLMLPLYLLILTLTDGLGEELAWRGFALPRLLTRHNALVASVVLGVFWGLWHLPLLWTEGAALYQQPIWLFLADITAKSVLFTWVFLHTRGSVLIAVLFHGATNLFLVSPGVAGTGDLGLPVLTAVAKWLLVLVLIAVAGPGLVRGPRPEALPRTSSVTTAPTVGTARVPRDRQNTRECHPTRPVDRPNLSKLAARQRRKGEMMSRLSSTVERHPIITFFVLTYALAWLIESPLVFLRDSITDTQGLVLVILASNVPSVLGIVLTAIVLGRGALRRLLGRLLIWRVDPRWYLVAVLGPVALAGGAVALNTLLGGPALSLGMPLLGVAVFLAFSIFPGSALGEEIGWRGYALPRLQAGGSALGASLILGPIWGLWHLPLWLTGAPGRTAGLYAAFVVSVIALSVILTWVYNSTGGSLLLVVLLHATFNLPMTLSLEALGSQAAVPLLLYWGLLVVAAIVVVIVAGPKHLSRKHRKQEERVVEQGVARPRVEPTPA